MSGDAETLAEVAALMTTEIRMYADAHGSWLPSDLAHHLTEKVVQPTIDNAEATTKAWEQNYDGMFWRWNECDTERLALKEQLMVARVRLRILTGTPIDDSASDWLAAHDAAVRDEALAPVRALAEEHWDWKAGHVLLRRLRAALPPEADR